MSQQSSLSATAIPPPRVEAGLGAHRTAVFDGFDNTSKCCPRFQPEGWDDRGLHFEHKPFALPHVLERSAMTRLAPIAVFLAAALALSACATAPPPSRLPPVELGNAAQGLAYAEQTCGSCHAIGAGEMHSPDARARSFDAIANTPGLTRTALNAWLHSYHTNMPDLIVEPGRIDDLYAYLATLKRRR